jgi:Glucose dehydrogenase
MIWLTAKQQAKIWVAAVALVATCGAAVAGSDAEQFARFKDANQWGAPAGDLNQTRFSALKEINTGNVKDLQMTWAQSTGALRGHEGQPLVINDVGGKPMMFFVSGCPDMSKCNIVQALDLSNPDQPVQVWHYMKTSGRDESAVPRACCDTVNRGGSYADGKFVFGTLDGYLIASTRRPARKHGSSSTRIRTRARRSRLLRSSSTTRCSSVSAATNSPRAAVLPPMRWPTARRCGSSTATVPTKTSA